MVGGLLAGMCGCLGAALIWHTFGPALYPAAAAVSSLLLPIRKGWVRG
jgi:undecaprenyl-diphosphatase